MMYRPRVLTSIALSSFLALSVTLIAQPRKTSDHWIATWATAPVARVPPSLAPPAQTPPAGAPGRAAGGGAGAGAAAGGGAAGARGGGAAGAGRGGNAPAVAPRPPFYPNNQTIRQIVHLSLGGDRFRVVLSNSLGSAPLAIGAAHVGIHAAGATVVAGSDRALTFAGVPSTTIPAGAVMVSDPVTLTVPNLADLAIDLFIPADTSNQVVTMHAGAFETNYVAAGNHAGDADLPGADTMTSWYFLSRVEVSAPERTPVIVALGDSITDGTASSIDGNKRWPDVLARRLMPAKSSRKIAIIDEGIAGNRVLAHVPGTAGINILARFDQDVLAQPGAQYVVVLEAINDIGLARQNPSPSAADLIAGHRQLIERAHEHGLKIYGATLTPFEGAAYASSEGEAKRAAINQWIRTSKEYDGVIDFEAAIRDPQSPTKFLPQFDSRDHLHPNDAGYEAMGNAIDLALFK
jgi:lysophospholipase L1-like esterase